MQYFFHFYFVFVLCEIVQVNYGILQEHAAGETVTSSYIEPRGKCTAENCTCAEIPKWIGIDCKDREYLPMLPELRFNNSTYLTEKIFLGLSLYSVILKNPDITIAENFLEGILGLKEFLVVQSSIKVIPDFRFVNNWIDVIDISSSHLSSLEGKHLQNLTIARRLWFSHNSIQYIDEDVFKGAEKVWNLNLDYNLLKFIPPKLLISMKSLGRFSVRHNNLLHVDELFYVTRPKWINLDFNNMTNFSLTALFNLEEAQPLLTSNIQELDLSYNFIKDTSLSISTCNRNHDSSLSILYLKLNGNELSYLNECLRCLRLTELEIIGNQIQFLTENDFISVSMIGKLLLRENQIRRIDAGTFKPFNTSLWELDLSFNKITSINGSVKYLSNLSMLNISHNSLQIFAEDEFTGLQSLYWLYLEHNQIKSLGTALQKLEKLKVLDIAHNDIKLIKKDQVPKALNYIYLAGNPFQCDCDLVPFLYFMKKMQDRGHFRADTSICFQSNFQSDVLKLQNCPHICLCSCYHHGYNFFTFVDCLSRDFSDVPLSLSNNVIQLEYIRFDSNYVGHFKFGMEEVAKWNASVNQRDEIHLKIRVLDWNYNFINNSSLSISPCCWPFTNGDPIFRIYNLKPGRVGEIYHWNSCYNCLQIYSMEFAERKIQFLTAEDFMSDYNTTGLVLRENQIRRIDTDTFLSVNSSLKSLDLSSNKIVSLNGSVRYLTALTKLYLSNNSIQIFSEDEFIGLESLRSLYLQQNQIKSLGTTLQKLKKLRTLNIDHNYIKSINRDQLPNTLEHLYFANNPLICDCKTLPLIDKFKGDKSRMCSRSKLEISLRKNHDCPVECSCKCTGYGDVFSMFVDCSSKNLSLIPHFMGNNLSKLKVNKVFSSDDRLYPIMYQNIDESLHVEGNVLGISLENNRLDCLDAAQLPPNLVQLYLSNNRLTRFPQFVFDSQLNLKQVSLSGNPWKCDCDALKFKKWLTSNKQIIKDFVNIRCGENNFNGTVLWQIDDVDLCPEIDLTLIFSVSFGALFFGTVCIFARLIYKKYELNIKVSLYSYGFTSVKEEFLVQDKPFDAFISFSHEDDEFVIKDIISEIENREPSIHLCLHYRHFRPGEPITDNIRHAVQESKMTVVILSRNFLESEWCLLEFKTALIQTFQDKVHRVIVIKTGELPKEIDPVIKIYLDSTTYLTWEESNFWNKLLYILPSRSSHKSPVLRFVGDNETVSNFSSFDLQTVRA